jgi:hypothetical protein
VVGPSTSLGGSSRTEKRKICSAHCRPHPVSLHVFSITSICAAEASVRWRHTQQCSAAHRRRSGVRISQPSATYSTRHSQRQVTRLLISGQCGAAAYLRGLRLLYGRAAACHAHRTADGLRCSSSVTIRVAAAPAPRARARSALCCDAADASSRRRPRSLLPCQHCHCCTPHALAERCWPLGPWAARPVPRSLRRCYRPQALCAAVGAVVAAY